METISKIIKTIFVILFVPVYILLMSIFGLAKMNKPRKLRK